MAAGLVPEGGRPLPTRPQGARQGGLPVPAEAVQTQMAVLEPSLLPVLTLSSVWLVCGHLTGVRNRPRSCCGLTPC